MWMTKLSSTLLVSLMIIEIGNGEKGRCLVNSPRPRGRNLTDKEGNKIPIKFEMTKSVSQRILSWVMNIYLDEVLGYDNIEMDSNWKSRSQFDIDSSLTRIQSKNVTINMEAWVPQGYDKFHNLVQNRTIRATPSKVTGWIGWFVPRRFFQYNHWTIFKDPNTAMNFSIDQNVVSIIQNSTIDAKSSISTNGTYTPGRCAVNPSLCTIMLTSDILIEDAIAQIEQMELYIILYCVGDTLKYVTSSLLQSNSSMLYIIRHWFPSDVISPNNFSNIALPQCGFDTTIFFCDKQFFSLRKIMWPKLERIAPVAFKIITDDYLSELYYNSLIRLLTPGFLEMSEYHVACNWINEIINSNRQWQPKNKESLTIGITLPEGSNGDALQEVVKLVEKAVNRNKSLEYYEFNFWCEKTAFSHAGYDRVLNSFLNDNKFPQPIGIIGPAYSQILPTVAMKTESTNTMVITYAAEGGNFNDRTKYPYFFRTIGSKDQYKYVYSQFFERFDWRRVATVIDNNPIFPEITSNLQMLFRNYNINLVSNLILPREKKCRETKELIFLELVEKKVKIIIVDVFIDAIHTVICAAPHLKLTAEQGYVWFLPGWLPIDWWRRNVTFESLSCTSDDLYRVIDGHFSIEQAHFGPDNQIMQENITIAQWQKNYNEFVEHKPLSNWAGYLYDACWTLVDAIQRFINETPNALDTIHGTGAPRFREIISQTDFYGLSGRVRFNDGTSRIVDLKIKQFVNNNYQTVANFHQNSSNHEDSITSGNFHVNTSAIVWLFKFVPNDGREPPPYCVFKTVAKALNVPCWIAIVIVNLIILVLSGILVVVGFFVCKRRCDKKRMRMHEELMKYQRASTSDSITSDEWEIPQNKIVLNRKIGEGAFGTVYGGEALLSDQDWIPVAVKTLKVGISIEEKSNFLSEIEIMKRFDHPNIIKLLGVCIKSEPVLTVMEFMLYGDLRSYLLARKHLVKNQGYEMSDEIGCKRLTGMALDVVKALCYLDKLRYVHRDVAARNCLVNADRVVKLADFGMTRSMYENDCYRHSWRGLLPIRWLAPESLSSGLFTSSSDVWSFGVLLYEIITFGKTPYGGKTHDQVMEYVTSGNTLPISPDAKQTLKNLMNSCWSMTRSKRPTPFEISVILVANPSLLEPCFHVHSSPLLSRLDSELPEEERQKSTLWESTPSIFNELASEPLDSPVFENKPIHTRRPGMVKIFPIDLGIGERILKPMDDSLENPNR